MAQTGHSQDPLISVGIPVYNGDRFLSQALSSLMEQSYANCEFIISDNASTDQTQAICEEFASHDPRISYFRQRKNIGAPRNWNFVVSKASGMFFKWASANDLCDPEFIAQTGNVLLADPSIVLCYGLTMLVNEEGKPIEVYKGDRSYNEALPSSRFKSVHTYLTLNNAQSGIFRLDTLRRTQLDRLYPTGDLNLIAELALYGKLHLIPEVLLYRRQSKETFTTMLTPLELQRVYDPDASGPYRLIRVRRFLDNIISIKRAPISLSEKLKAFKFTLQMANSSRLELAHEVLSILTSGKIP